VRERLALGVACGAFSAAIWGGQFVVAKDTLRHLGPFETNALRYVPIVVLLGALLWGQEGREAFRLDGRGRAVVGLSAGTAAYNLLNYTGVRYTLAQNGALIQTLTPLFAMLVVWGARGTRPTRETVAIFVVALAGVGLVITHGHLLAYVDHPRWGDLLCTCSALAFALYTIGMVEVGDFSAVRITTLVSIGGAAIMWVAAAIADAVAYDPFPSAHDLRLALPGLAYLAIPGVVIAMLTWNFSARFIGSANTALLVVLVPLTTFVIQIIRGYRPGAAEYAGAVLAMAAVTANNLLQRRSALRLAAEP
jgi:drug/metabolite transporter (DMT)-like permease